MQQRVVTKLKKPVEMPGHPGLPKTQHRSLPWGIIAFLAVCVAAVVALRALPVYDYIMDLCKAIQTLGPWGGFYFIGIYIVGAMLFFPAPVSWPPRPKTSLSSS